MDPYVDKTLTFIIKGMSKENLHGSDFLRLIDSMQFQYSMYHCVLFCVCVRVCGKHQYHFIVVKVHSA